MPHDYAKIHLFFTIPQAIALHCLLAPIRTIRDMQLTGCLVAIAIVSTTPWDSYLIRTGVWSYPPTSILGPTLFSIPVEEVFFFFIQTYITSHIYLILSKPIVHARYLSSKRVKSTSKLSQAVFAALVVLLAASFVARLPRELTYMTLIIRWSTPFLFFLWTVTGTHVTQLPAYVTVVPIMLPTLYLWLVDTFALHRGYWVIETGTKVGIYLWPGLELEEAIFFLLTNCMVVLGLIAVHKCLAVYDLLPAASKSYVRALVLAFTNDSTELECDPKDIDEACQVLRVKSKSFFAASMLFEGRVKLDLLKLYTFCRVADDMIDEHPTDNNIEILDTFIRDAYTNPAALSVPKTAPQSAYSALRLFPSIVPLIPQDLLLQLLEGFRMDKRFDALSKSGQDDWPIKTEEDLLWYAQRVAGSVGAMCTHLLWPLPINVKDDDRSQRLSVLQRAQLAGRALQLINISRDILSDARDGRCYIPSAWLAEYGSSPDYIVSVIKSRDLPTVDMQIVRKCQIRLVNLALKMWEQARMAIDLLPGGRVVRGAMRAVVEVYLEIGREILKRDVVEERVTVSKMQRLRVAWKAVQIQT